jgi:hypothetical protein
MMRFNWLHRGYTQDVATVEELIKELDGYGYYSVLLTYHSKADDYFIKAARVLTNKQKIKLMLAIRTYAISPEYLSMICKSLNHISNEKIIELEKKKVESNFKVDLYHIIVHLKAYFNWILYIFSNFKLDRPTESYSILKVKVHK